MNTRYFVSDDVDASGFRAKGKNNLVPKTPTFTGHIPGNTGQWNLARRPTVDTVSGKNATSVCWTTCL